MIGFRGREEQRRKEIPFVHSHKSLFLCENPALACVSVRKLAQGQQL